jgi:polyisoprenoid-binding protein YceI
MIRAKSFAILLTFVAFSAAQAQAPAGATIVKEDSKIEFHASSTFAKVVGEFMDWDANLQMVDGNLKDGTLALDLKSNSVHTGSGLKDKEVKGKNFFNVKEYPDIHFASTGMLPDPDPQKFTMTGNLTLRGITRPVTVAVTLSPLLNGNQRLEADFSFNRRDFGMTHNMMFNKIADTIRVTMELHVKPSSPALAPGQ